MSKRFVDTARYRQAWRKLDPKLRAAFYWLTENCDAAGYWTIDLDHFKFECGYPLDVAKFIAETGAAEMHGTDALRMVDFIEVNYGALRDGYNPHKPALRTLAHRQNPSLKQASSKLEDEEEDKDEEEGEDKEGGGAGEPKPKRKGPDPNVQGVIDYLTATLIEKKIAKSLDVDTTHTGQGNRDGNRLAAYNLINKLAADYPDDDPLTNAKLLIDYATGDQFHRAHCTKVRYLYKHCGTLIAQARDGRKNPKTQSDNDRKQQLADAATRHFGKAS